MVFELAPIALKINLGKAIGTKTGNWLGKKAFTLARNGYNLLFR